MIKARYNRFYTWFFFDVYFRLKFEIQFRKMTFLGELNVKKDQSVLLLQNHYSWHDGYWSYAISKQIVGRRFHVMMLEEQLLKRKFLHRCGVFSVRKNSREMLESIEYTKALLINPGNLVTIYPTGQFHTLHHQNLKFQKGIERIVGNDSEHISIVMAVTLVDFFGFPSPEVRIYLENYSGHRSVEAIEKAYLSFYQQCISKQTE